MRLGFFYHTPMRQTANGQLLTAGYLGVFLDSLAPHVERLLCFMYPARTDADMTECDYALQHDNIAWINIGAKQSAWKMSLFPQSYTRHLHAHLHEIDALLIRAPSPLAPALGQAVDASTPTILLLVGDYLSGIDDLSQRSLRRELIRLWARWNTFQQDRLAQHSLTFVNSQSLYDQYHGTLPDLYLTRTTTLSTSDFYSRTDTCTGDVIRLLYTGRINHAKGLLELTQATLQLRQQGYPVVLDVVGWWEEGDTIMDEMQALAQESDDADALVYHGFKTVGAELFAYYKRADIYLIGSKSDFEGFPRSVWEAMAHSVPVVATQVGSIPHYLTDGEHALLVEPRNVSALVDATRRLIATPVLRQTLIANGYALARQNTLEIRSQELMSRIKTYVQGEPA